MKKDLSEQFVSTLVGSRICHDLINPLGAIGNGVELLTMYEGEVAPELSLIADSVASASAKIRLFRIAFGAATEAQQLSEQEIKSALLGLQRSPRLTIIWHPEGSQSRLDIKLAFLALNCLDSALPYGGDLRVETSDRTWKITGLADRFQIENHLWDGLASGRVAEDISPSEVQFALLTMALDSAGRSCVVGRSHNNLSIRF